MKKTAAVVTTPNGSSNKNLLMLLTVAMQNKLERLFKELNDHIQGDPEHNKKLIIRQWQRYNDWLVESERVSLEAFLQRIVDEQRDLRMND